MIRNIPKVVQSIANGTVSYTSSPAGTYRSSTDIVGSVIDRETLGRRYSFAVPFGLATGFASTEADRKVTLGIKLQQGDSSGGGDLADFSTESQPDDAIAFSTGLTTDMVNWTTGALRAQTRPGTWDLRKAGRFIAPVLTPTIDRNATSTGTAAELLSISGGVVFIHADEEPARANTDAFSTSTTT